MPFSVIQSHVEVHDVPTLLVEVDCSPPQVGADKRAVTSNREALTPGRLSAMSCSGFEAVDLTPGDDLELRVGRPVDLGPRPRRAAP